MMRDGQNTRRWAIRLFLTCWLVYCLHFATNMVRENYLALAIGDHLSFRVDGYSNLHDDIFEKKGYGWHIGSNPGASMLAAIPYALARPVIDRIVDGVRQSRDEAGLTEPPSYDSPIGADRNFYFEAWRRGLDVKFGLALLTMQAGCMSVLSAGAVTGLFMLLVHLTQSRTTALWLALLYAFGTPVFLRTGFLNHNMILGHVAFLGFVTLWNPLTREDRWPFRRLALAGGAGGLCLLLDYSGVVMLVGLLVYALLRYRPASGMAQIRQVAAYAAGALGPIALLWVYQWKSFGHPFLPPQHWMPPVDWIEEGYQGFDVPQLGNALSLAFDWRYGLFVSCPLFLLALVAPFQAEDGQRSNLSIECKTSVIRLPQLELWTCLGLVAALALFFSGVHYTRWQFNTGVRYLAPTFPFLFLLATGVILQFPRWGARLLTCVAVGQGWSMAMYRDVSGGKVELTDPDAGLGVLDPIIRVFTEGPTVPALTTLSRMEGYGGLTAAPISPLLIFAPAALAIGVLWWPIGVKSSVHEN